MSNFIKLGEKYFRTSEIYDVRERKLPSDPGCWVNGEWVEGLTADEAMALIDAAEKPVAWDPSLCALANVPLPDDNSAFGPKS